MRPQVARILRDLENDDEDINTYAAMNVLRLKQIAEDELAALLPVLRTSTTHESISVRFFAKKALNEVKLQMRKFPTFESEYEKLKEECGASSWSHLLSTIEEADTDAKLVILDLMRDIDDPQILPALTSFLRNERDVFVVAEGIKVLGLLGNESSIPVLEAYLKHDDSRIRSNAVEALEGIGGKDVVRSILPLLEDDDNRVKGTVAAIVGRHGEHNVLVAMAGMLHSVEIWMRESATYALGHVPYAESVDLLLEALCDVNPDIQKKAIQSLGRLQASKARDFLNTIAASADAGVAQVAQAALRQIAKDPKEYPYFDESNRFDANPIAKLAAKGKTAKHGLPKAPRPMQKRVPEPERPTTPMGAVEGALARFRLFGRKGDGGLDPLSDERNALREARAAMLEKVGKRVMELHGAGQINRPYLPYFRNEIKKLRYLIEQKELQKRDMKEESRTTTFMSFLKESVSRFTQEKQVDQRMESLYRRLRGKYVELGTKIYGEKSSRDDLSLYELRLDEIRKLDAQIARLDGPGKGGDVVPPEAPDPDEDSEAVVEILPPEETPDVE